MGRSPDGVEIIVPSGRHWSASPTTQMLRCSRASRMIISFCAALVSWYSSTSRCLKRVW